MTEVIACLKQGKIELLQQGRAARRLISPYQRKAEASHGTGEARMVAVTRGRKIGELCYAISTAQGTRVFAQPTSTGQEEQLFFGADTRVSEVDLSFAAAALTCTVLADQSRSWIGLLADDGKGVRTVTEGDVVDCNPRWAPGGRAEIVYASAGIGRTRRGAWAGLSPFALHRLRFADSSVEVLVADGYNDYLAPLPLSDSCLYAIRRNYRALRAPAPIASLGRLIRGFLGVSAVGALADSQSQELICITPEGTRLIARGVTAFDVTSAGQIVYANDAGVFRIGEGSSQAAALVSELNRVERVVISE